MNFNESVRYLHSLGNEVLAMKLGLETIRLLSRSCGDPHQKYPAIHLAGTNGKGSTAAMINSILKESGYRVGLCTSPHLVSPTERIRLDGDEIDKEHFAELATHVRTASERLVKVGQLDSPPTFFEQITMIAFLAFAEKTVDIAVLEVGMGGRLDATNICHPLITVITPVSYDHQKHLGHTLSEIAAEKAGIIKAGIPVVVSPQEKEAMSVIVERAAALSARVVSVEQEARLSREYRIEATKEGVHLGQYKLHYLTARAAYDLLLGLRGKHQAINALTAIHIAEELSQRGWKIAASAVIEGLRQVKWPGRLELITRTKLPGPLLLDGAHNAAGAETLRDFLVEHFPSQPITLVFGAVADKAIERMAEILFPLARTIIVTKSSNPRSAEPGSIARLISPVEDIIVICTADATSALSEAIRHTPPEGVICICGSLFLVGEVRGKLVPQNKS